MKRQIILAVAIIFTLALFAPAASYAFKASTTPVVQVDNKEKKDVTKTETTTTTEKKSEATTTGETKACCDKAGKEGCCKGANKSETKACTGDQKTCAGEKKSCCPSQKTVK